MLVVSELQAEEASSNVDFSGLHNVSNKVKKVNEQEVSKDLPLNPPLEPDILSEPPPAVDADQMTFPDTLSVNSVTTDG